MMKWFAGSPIDCVVPVTQGSVTGAQPSLTVMRGCCSNPLLV